MYRAPQGLYSLHTECHTPLSFEVQDAADHPFFDLKKFEGDKVLDVVGDADMTDRWHPVTPSPGLLVATDEASQQDAPPSPQQQHGLPLRGCGPF